MKTSDEILLERAIELTQKHIDENHINITFSNLGMKGFAKYLITEDFLHRFRELFNDIDRSQTEL